MSNLRPIKRNSLLSPMFSRNNIFDVFEDFFNKDSFLGNISPINNYNIEKLNNSSYRIYVNVAGYKKEEIELFLEDGYLNIEAKSKLEKNNEKYIHQGISSSFRQSFSIEEEAEIINAELQDGILHIDIKVKDRTSKPSTRIPIK